VLVAAGVVVEDVVVEGVVDDGVVVEGIVALEAAAPGVVGVVLVPEAGALAQFSPTSDVVKPVKH
jgi:hypothetical protein